ncbi:MAG: carboxylesterase family protein [Eubacteriales bacterium]|nr:carboxylesterase family protein [Eubacteriales bacterium]
MKKRNLWMTGLLLLTSMTVFSGCGKNENVANDSTEAVVAEENIASCYNGNFIGEYEEETGVLSFKGIPYAKAPVGELRWKAPAPVDESTETFKADTFGKSSIQYEWHSEPITTERSEDCLTLNVWTDSVKGKKPVMVFFHGGSFAWGGTSEELYNGQYIVDENEDVVVVTCNYRVGMMGFIDLSRIEGGEDYADSKELGLLDAMESLRWIKQNISAFGGDPDNVTIFGESAGSTMVGCLLASDDTEGLFKRAICESGSFNLTFSEEDYKESIQPDMLLQATGAKNMDDLLALSEEELIEANELSLDEDDMTVNDYYSLPLRGNIVPVDPYEAIQKGQAKGIDVMIGTNTDEICYWVAEMGEVPMTEMDEDGVNENLAAYEEYFIDPMYDHIVETVSKDDLQKIEAYLDLHKDLDPLWAKSALITEALFREPSIKAAETHASSNGDGKTYMYYFGKRSDNFDFVGACHASELAYVFHNVNETDFSGTVDTDLANRMCKAWVNFAKTGDPSTDDVVWEEYDPEERNTMVIGNDGSMTMTKDPEGESRELTAPLSEYYFWSAGA